MPYGIDWSCRVCEGTGEIEGIGCRTMPCEDCYGVGKGSCVEIDMFYAQNRWHIRSLRELPIKALPSEL